MYAYNVTLPDGREILYKTKSTGKYVVAFRNTNPRPAVQDNPFWRLQWQALGGDIYTWEEFCALRQAEHNGWRLMQRPHHHRESAEISLASIRKGRFQESQIIELGPYIYK